MAGTMDVRAAHLDNIGIECDESWKALRQVSVTTFLNSDRRPAFILDLHSKCIDPKQQIQPVFTNPALRNNPTLFDRVAGSVTHGNFGGDLTHQGFVKWARTTNNETLAVNISFGGANWEAIILDQRWRVFVANLVDDVNTPVVSGPTPKVNGFLSTSLVSDVSSEQPSQDPSTSPHDQDEQAETPSLPDQNSVKPGVNVAAVVRNGNISSKKPSTDSDLLAKIAGCGTIGIVVADLEGEILFCNDAYHRIHQLPRGISGAMSWLNLYEEDEIPRIAKIWERVAINQEAIQFQGRLKCRWKPPAGHHSAPKDFPTWISCWSYPDMSSDGETIGACGVIADITEQKWAESLMERKLADAVDHATFLETDTETRFRSLCDMMPIGIWVSDEVGKVIYANDAYRDLMKSPCDPDTTEAQPWWDMIPEEDLAMVREFYRQILEDHVKVSVELRIKKYRNPTKAQEGEYRWFSAKGYAELYEDGRFKHMTGSLTDISDLKLAEQLQRARASDALESKQKLERFIDMTSHEMRNPLSAIVHSAEEVLTSLRGRDPCEVTTTTITDVTEAAETILYCTDHSTRIVDDILLVSKLESGLINIVPTIVQPINAVKQALRMFDGEMRAAGITQSFVISQSFDSLQIDLIYFDANRVLQVLVNLVTNAIKFTRPESIRQIHISMEASLERPVSASEDSGVQYLDAQVDPSSAITGPMMEGYGPLIYISFAVSDTGCGLSKVEQKRLFQRFSQAKTRTHVKYGGTGLGLFISRQLCEMQGGQIGLRSSPNQGSTFSFYVAARRSPPGQLHHDRNSPSNPSYVKSRASTPLSPASSSSVPSKPLNLISRKQNASSLSVPSEQKTVLLVEDNLINQKIVAKKLSMQGYKVIVANHGMEALDRIRESGVCSRASGDVPIISLVLLDMEMPVMDGLTCIRHIREMEEVKELRFHVPVIAVTANARQDQINQAKEAGMDDIVTKPFRMEELFSVMTRLEGEFPIPVPHGL